MRRIVLLVAALFLGLTAAARADAGLAGAQQKLKDQGFYYGEVTGQKDADTTAAIRRYQIRNGLKITGELNAETQKSLGVKGGASAPRPTPTPARSYTPAPAPRPTRPPPSTEFDDDAAPAPEQRGPRSVYPDSRTETPGYAPGPRGLAPEMSGIFDRTPFEVAPIEVQRRVIVGAQSLLARQGYYRSAIDGEYGPAMNFALRAYQTRFGMDANGRLDMETLAALGLLPGQRAPGLTAPHGRVSRRPTTVAPNGEPIYIPR